jgi:TRAP-type C4-dicarboxylate transport system permease small subunit
VGWLKRAAELVGVALFAGMFATFVVEVFMRFVVNRPLEWTVEVSSVTYVWCIFWGCAFLVSERDHVAFDLVYSTLPARGRRLFAALAALLVGGLFVAALPQILDYVHFMARESTPVLGLRMDLVDSCFALFVGAVAVRAVLRLVELARPNWRERL